MGFGECGEASLAAKVFKPMRKGSWWAKGGKVSISAILVSLEKGIATQELKVGI